MLTNKLVFNTRCNYLSGAFVARIWQIVGGIRQYDFNLVLNLWKWIDCKNIWHNFMWRVFIEMWIKRETRRKNHGIKLRLIDWQFRQYHVKLVCFQFVSLYLSLFGWMRNKEIECKLFGPFSYTREHIRACKWTHPGKCVVKHCTHIGYTIIIYIAS